LLVDWQYADLDSDLEIDSSVYWYNNNILSPEFTNKTIIPSSNISKGDSWYCIVQIFDGEDWSQNQTSQKINITELTVNYQWNDPIEPSSITFYAEFQELSFELTNVTLFYQFQTSTIELQTLTEIKPALYQNKDQETDFNSIQMFLLNNNSDSTTYSATIDFAPNSDVEVIFWIEVADIYGNNVANTLYSEYAFRMPISDINWSEIIPLLILVSIIPMALLIFTLFVRKRRQIKNRNKILKQREILERFSDVISLRAIICRNHHGLAFYTENFVGGGQDEDMVAGLTTAMSSLVSDVTQRQIKPGEFDALEREGFSILSYHGSFTTISLLSDAKMSSFMKEKMSELIEQIEKNFTQKELEGVISAELRLRAKNYVYDILPVGLLKPLMIDMEQFQKKSNQFTKQERNWWLLTKDIPSFKEAQQVFYAFTFLSNLTLKGITQADAFRYLEHCYELKVVRKVPEDELESEND
jgi:hypothetical protein